MMHLNLHTGLLILYIFEAASRSVFGHFAEPSTTASKQIVFLVSFDGFRWDYLTKTQTPNFDFIIKTGVKANHVINTFITRTFPNHYSIVTGLYEESHGIVSNTMYDPIFNSWFFVNNSESRWWNQGEPIWITNQRADKGRKSATVFWPGSTVKIRDQYPWRYKSPYNGSLSLQERVDFLVNSLLEDDPPTFLALYFEEPDSSGHKYGPDSLEVEQAIRKVDNGTGYLLEKLRHSGHIDKVNLIITSDHGMASVSDKRVIYLSDCNITADMYTLADTGPPHLGTTAAILPHPGKLGLIYSKLKNGCHPHMTVYKKEDIPERYHYTHNRRITPILAVADEGWQITSDRHQHLGHHKGNHGYSNSVSSMHPFFIARGPAFKEGYLSEPFRNVDIYPLICDILGITPAPNNGSLLQVKHLLKPNNNGAKQNYSMLVFLVIVIFIVFGLMSYGIVSFCANHHCKMRRYGQIYDLGTDDFDL